MKRPLIAGAQKLYLTLKAAIQFAHDLKSTVAERRFSSEIAVCPSPTNLAHVAEALAGSSIGLGAQDVHQEDTGAFTGQVSIRELLDLNVRYVILGHSELRMQRKETNADVNRKVRICLRHGAAPIACVGEDIAQRRAGLSMSVIEKDLREVFDGISESEFGVGNVVIAYEPVWAIKTGPDDKRPAATPDVAGEMHDFMKGLMGELYSKETVKNIRFLYGGSVSAADEASAKNTRVLLSQPSIDGFLVGTASVKMATFLPILELAESTLIADRAYTSPAAEK